MKRNQLTRARMLTAATELRMLCVQLWVKPTLYTQTEFLDRHICDRHLYSEPSPSNELLINII